MTLYRFAVLSCAICLMLALGGCALPEQHFDIKSDSGQTIHVQVDGQPDCSPHIYSCWRGDRLFLSSLDPAAWDHEQIFHAKHGGKHMEPWFYDGNIAYTFVTDVGTNPDWRRSDCMMRIDAGPVRHCDAEFSIRVKAQHWYRLAFIHE